MSEQLTATEINEVERQLLAADKSRSGVVMLPRELARRIAVIVRQAAADSGPRDDLRRRVDNAAHNCQVATDELERLSEELK